MQADKLLALSDPRVSKLLRKALAQGSRLATARPRRKRPPPILVVNCLVHDTKLAAISGLKRALRVSAWHARFVAYEGFMRTPRRGSNLRREGAGQPLTMRPRPNRSRLRPRP